MIFTVTFNPSLDYIVRVDEMRLGTINRTNYEQLLPGGKGINVSIVLGNLGHPSRALGFSAGVTGVALEKLLADTGVDADLVHVKAGFTRINAKVKAVEETEINGQGPRIAPEDVDALFSKLDVLGQDDTLVISGSVPNTLPSDMYEQVMERLAGRGVRIVVDAERDLLTRVLPYRPFLVKPNNIELGDIYGARRDPQDPRRGRSLRPPHAGDGRPERARLHGGGGWRARGRRRPGLPEPGRQGHRGQLRRRGRLLCGGLPRRPHGDRQLPDGLPDGPGRRLCERVQRPPGNAP